MCWNTLCHVLMYCVMTGVCTCTNVHSCNAVVLSVSGMYKCALLLLYCSRSPFLSSSVSWAQLHTYVLLHKLFLTPNSAVIPFLPSLPHPSPLSHPIPGLCNWLGREGRQLPLLCGWGHSGDRYHEFKWQSTILDWMWDCTFKTCAYVCNVIV